MNFCLICKTETLQKWGYPIQDPWTHETFLLSECTQCKLIQIQNRPQSNELEKYYNNFSGSEMRSSSVNSLHWKLKNIQLSRESEIFKKADRPIQSILDYGCGNGQFLVHLKNQNYSVSGIDLIDSSLWPHPTIPYQAIKKHPDSGEKINFPKTDLLIMRHVIEHLLDPISVLQSAHQNEIPYLWIVVPNVESLFRKLLKNYWSYWDPPRHLAYYSKETLNTALKKAGYEPIYNQTFGIDEIVTSFYHYLLLNYPTRQWMRGFSPKSSAAAISSALSAYILPSSIGILARRA